MLLTFLILFKYSRLYQIYHKKHETLTTIPPIHPYINKINNRLTFKLKDRYKQELRTPETMKLLGSTKKLINKIKNGEKVTSYEAVEVVLIQFNLVDNQYQRNSEVLYTFPPNKFCGYLLNVESSNLLFLKTYKTEFDEIKDRVNLQLIWNCDDIL